MKLEVSRIQSSGFVEVMATHKDHEPLIWPTPAYGKVRLADQNAVFKGINAYWETLSEEALDAIWECYQNIHSNTRSITDSHFVANNIRFYVNRMYSFMPMDSFRHWMNIHGNLHVPSEIQDTINADSRYTDESQTYLKADYINLAIFSLALRPMIPVWGGYLDLINDNQKGKELESLGLIYDTELMTWPENTQGAKISVVEKLQRYIDERIRDNSISMDSTWKGMGSAEIPNLILAKVIVRRLTIAITDDPTATSVIASVHWYIRYCLNPNARTTADRVNDKRINTNAGDDDDKGSFIDAHKIKNKVTMGDAIAFEKGAERMALIVQDVDPTVDLKLLELCLDRISSVESMIIPQHSIRLAQWVNAKAVSPKAYSHIEKHYLHLLIAGAQSLLWHWGFIDVALLMQVERYVESGATGTALPIAAKSYPRVNPKYKDELNAAYPYLKPQRPKRGDTDPDSQNKNYASLAINDLTALIRNGNWVYHGPKELWNVSDQMRGHNLIALPQHIKTTLTDVVLHLANISK